VVRIFLLHWSFTSVIYLEITTVNEDNEIFSENFRD
jgi:hypothetical protein